MIKKLFLVIATLFLTFNLFAQYKPFQFGFRVAPDVGWLKVDSEGLSSKGAKGGMRWGFVADYYFVENYGFSTGFNIISTKGSYKFDYGNHNIKRKFSERYIEIPFLLRMRTDDLGKIRICGEIGYGLGVRMSGKDELHNENGDEFYSADYPSFKPIRSSLIISLGFEYNVFESSYLTAALVFDDNFSNLLKDNASQNHDVKANTIALEIGFLF